MLRRLVKGLIKRRKATVRDTVVQALRLHLCGVPHRDDPKLMDMTVRLQVRWRARELHPWYHDLPDQAARELAQQTLSDTDTVLERIFAACPDADVIELTVIEPNPDGNRRVMFGTVRRDEFAQWHPPSTDMRLRLVGLHYRLVDEKLEPLPAERYSEGQENTPIVSGLAAIRLNLTE